MPVECVCQNPACGKRFLTTPLRIAQGRGKCCSKTCTYQCMRAGEIERVCQNPACGKTFYLPPSTLKRSNRPYCSMRCRSEAKTVLSICQNPDCGKAFRAFQAEVRKGGGKYCCWTCRPKSRPRICQNPACQKSFLAIPSKIEQGRARFCSVNALAITLGIVGKNCFGAILPGVITKCGACIAVGNGKQEQACGAMVFLIFKLRTRVHCEPTELHGNC